VSEFNAAFGESERLLIWAIQIHAVDAKFPKRRAIMVDGTVVVIGPRGRA